MENKAQKYDVKRIFASDYAEKNNANVEDITIRVFDNKGTKKVMVEIGFGDDTGWQTIKRYFATNLPTSEDLAVLRGKRVVDVLLQTGWNEDDQKWGKIKATKFILDGGEELTLSGAKDEPGLSDAADED